MARLGRIPRAEQRTCGPAACRAIAILAAIVLGSCGGSSSHAATKRAAHRPASIEHSAAARPTPVALVYRPLFSLSAAVQDPAVAALGQGKFVLLGGIDAGQTSTASVVLARIDGATGSASLPGAQHDAQAAVIDGEVYVFGGAEFTQYDHILRFDPASRSVGQVGTLPRVQSDVAVAATDGTAYVVGGYDGSVALDTIVAWRPGSSARVVAHLPVALRYAAVTAVGRDLLIMGGSTPSGASDAIYRFDSAAGRVAQIGRLPRPITHAGAAVLHGEVYLVGGRGDSLEDRSDAVWAIDPDTGAVRRAGRLPRPLSDAGVLADGGTIIVIGGHSGAGTQAGIGDLVPAG